MQSFMGGQEKTLFKGLLTPIHQRKRMSHWHSVIKSTTNQRILSPEEYSWWVWKNPDPYSDASHTCLILRHHLIVILPVLVKMTSYVKMLVMFIMHTPIWIVMTWLLLIIYNYIGDSVCKFNDFVQICSKCWLNKFNHTSHELMLVLKFRMIWLSTLFSKFIHFH